MPTICPSCGFSGEQPTDAPSEAPPPQSPYSTTPYGSSPFGGGYAPPASPVPQPPQQAPPPPGHAAQVPPTNGLATASLVTGIVGLCVPVLPIVALVLGIIGLRQCKERNERGEGMAITGIVLGAVALLLGFFWMSFWMPWGGPRFFFIGAFGGAP